MSFAGVLPSGRCPPATALRAGAALARQVARRSLRGVMLFGLWRDGRGLRSHPRRRRSARGPEADAAAGLRGPLHGGALQARGAADLTDRPPQRDSGL